MSVYAAFDEGPGVQVASNKGWGDICRLINIYGGRYSKQLAATGVCEHMGLLVDELRELMAHASESEESTLEGLIEALEGQELVLITDGMQT